EQNPRRRGRRALAWRASVRKAYSQCVPMRMADAQAAKGGRGLRPPLHLVHRELRHRWHAFPVLPGPLRIGGVAVERALVDALGDGGDAEKAEGDEEGPVGDAVETRPAAISFDIFRLGRNPRRFTIDAAKTVPRIGHSPVHALIGEVRKRVSE